MAFGSDSQIDILVTLKNQASAELARLRSSVNDMQKGANEMGDAWHRAGSMFSTEIGLMKTAAKAAVGGITLLGGAIATAGAFAIKSAADFEQNRIAFEVMLGSAEKAGKMMKDITQFAKETPFQLPEVVEGAKRLLAYNVEAEKLIPTFKMLGEIASGVGKDKLPNLILAFGQVKAATKLTGMELRQFTEAGVPMLSILTQLGKEGKLTSQSQKAMGATTAASSGKIKELSTSLAIAEQRLKEVKKNTDAKKSSVMSATAAVDKYRAKLGAATKTVSGFGDASKITEGQVQEMISEGVIKFADVQLALEAMTAEGGRFHDLMIRQSTTLSGVWSNLSDSLGIIARQIVGMNSEGEVREGSLFDRLRNAAANFYQLLSDNQDAIANFFATKVDYAVQKVREWWDSMGGTQGVVQKLQEMWGTLVNDVLPAITSFIGMVIDLTKWIKDNWSWLWKVIAAYEALKLLIAGAGMVSAFASFSKMVLTASTNVGILSKAIGLLPVAIPITIALIGFSKIMDQISAVGEAIDSLEKSRSDLSDRVQSLKKKMDNASTDEEREKYKKQISDTGKALQSIADTQSGIASSLTIGSFFFGKKHGGYARGRANGGSISDMDEVTLVGEEGPEILKLPVGSRVIPNHKSRMGGTTVHNWNFQGAIVNGKADIIRMVEDVINRKTELNELGSTT